jgi:HD-GYP domain-containing protein (c-di-GMP phosphodiesterase class II)
VTTMTGTLMMERDRTQLRALADHLRRHEGVTVRVYDASGHMIMPSDDSPTCPSQAEQCDAFIARGCSDCRQSGSSDCFTCPQGRNVQILPIERSSVYFGSLVACTSDDTGADATTSGAVLDAMLQILTDQSAKEHEIDSLATELALRYEEIELLYEIDEKIPLRSYVSNVIEYVAQKSFAVLNCTCLAWVDNTPNAGGTGECRLFWSPNESSTTATMLRLEAEQLARAVAERCMRTGEAQAISSLDDDSEFSAFASELNSVLCLPLQVETDFFGTLIAFKPQGDQFTSYELKLMAALARKSAFVIRDSRLYEDLDSLFFNLIKLLVNTIENKDEYTKGHSQRVRSFTVRLAELAGLTRSEIDTLNLSGLLHDIGKQGIPDAILKKEGRLDDEERAMINTHSMRGVNLLKHITQFDKCLPHIRHHHERIDGNGYPDGLKGEQIPLGARIIAVADTFDALTSDRCYRPRFTTDKAFTIVEEVAGTQLDSDIAQLLLNNREEFSRQCQGAHALDLAGPRTRVSP